MAVRRGRPQGRGAGRREGAGQGPAAGQGRCPAEEGPAAEEGRRPARRRVRGPRPAGHLRRLAGRAAQGVLPRPQPLARRRQGRAGDARHHRRQREGSDQERVGELGVRRGAVPALRDVVVAGRPEDRLLPVRREQGARLLPGARSGRAHDEARRRALPQGRGPEPRGRAAGVRRDDKEDGENRRAGRQAVHQRRGRALRLPRVVVAGRHRAAVQPDEPPAERVGVRGRGPGDRQVPGGRAGGVAGELDGEPSGDPVPQGRPAVRLDLRPDRLEEPLPLRPRRQADRPAHRACVRGGAGGAGR